MHKNKQPQQSSALPASGISRRRDRRRYNRDTIAPSVVCQAGFIVSQLLVERSILDYLPADDSFPAKYQL